MNAFDYEEKGKIWLETMNFCLEIFLKVDVHSLNLMIVTYPSICSHAHTEFHVQYKLARCFGLRTDYQFKTYALYHYYYVDHRK